ncbi:DUF3993 domain-containing protein [Bacillus cereus]|uniref:DUF3993 domain-containing protein n=1 Tax=Bacillus cereus TaxID=1396 RepID=UPI0026B7FCEE
MNFSKDCKAIVKRYGVSIVLFLCVVCMIEQSMTTVFGKEENEVNREEIFGTIQQGYEAQFSIRNKELSMDKMYDTLSPYFTHNFLQVFTDENSDSGKQHGEYLFPTKETPFSFQAETKVVHDKKYGLLYVYERGKNKCYQIVTLQKEEGNWKIAGYHESKQLLSEIKNLQK